MSACVLYRGHAGELPATIEYCADREAAMREVFRAHLRVVPHCRDDGFALRLSDDRHARHRSSAACMVAAIPGTATVSEASVGGCRERWVACVALAFAVLASPVRAQDLSTLTLPQRVRLTAPVLALRDYRGTWSSLNGDTLVVDDRRVSRHRLTALSLSNGSRSQWRWGAVMGAAAGAVLGAVMCRRSDCQEADLGVHFGVLTAAAGALGGVIIGSNVRTERWRAVSISSQTR